MARQLEQGTVPGHQQVGARSERELEKFLIVAIAAGGKPRAPLGSERVLDEARYGAAALEARRAGRLVEGALAEGIRQDAGELGLAGRIDHDFGALRRRAER